MWQNCVPHGQGNPDASLDRHRHWLCCLAFVKCDRLGVIFIEAGRMTWRGVTS